MLLLLEGDMSDLDGFADDEDGCVNERELLNLHPWIQMHRHKRQSQNRMTMILTIICSRILGIATKGAQDRLQYGKNVDFAMVGVSGIRYI